MSNVFVQQPAIQKLLRDSAGLDVAGGDERFKAIIHRLLENICTLIDDYNVTEEEFWHAVNYLHELGGRQEAALLDERKDDLLRQQAQARATLKRWTGEDAPDALDGDFPHWTIDAAHSRQALRRHPALAAYDPMTREAEALVREAVAEKKPDWSWELDYQRRSREFGDMMTLQVSFDLPLFSATRQDPKIAARRAQVRQLEAERAAMTREYEQRLESDLAEYRRLQRALERSTATLLPLAEEKVRLALAGYRAGTLDLEQLLGARQQRVEAQLRQIDLQGSLAQLAARLYFTYEEGRA